MEVTHLPFKTIEKKSKNAVMVRESGYDSVMVREGGYEREKGILNKGEIIIENE